MKKSEKNPGGQAVSTALIVAAGLGTRLEGGEGGRGVAGGSMPKPLRPLVGVPVIARVMDSGAKAGIRRFVVVIGHEAGLMRERLPGLAPPGCELDLVLNHHYREPNGLSLLSGLESMSAPFALLMSDHIFSPTRLTLAIKEFRRDGVSRLVVERKDHFDGDLEDATLARVDGDGFITALGKGLEEYDGVDTGMFVLQPGPIREAAKKAGPSPSISDIMGVLAHEKGLKALFMDEGYWQDVDTPADMKRAEEKLYASLVKPADGFLARHINRRVSLAMSRRLWRLGATPNMVTSFTLVLGLLAGLAFSRGNAPGWGLLGAALFQAPSIIDGVDGELARLLLKASPSGFWYDMFADNITHMAVFAGIAMGQRAGGAPGPWVFLAVLSVLGVIASVAAVSPLLRPTGQRQRDPNDNDRDTLLSRVVDALTSRDFSYFLFPLAILDWLGGFIWVVAIGTWAYTILVIALRLRSRKRAAA